MTGKAITRCFAAAFFSLLLGQYATAQEAKVSGAKIVWYGVYKVGESKEVPDKSSPTGTRLLSSGIIPPSTSSDRIPAVLGTRFGVGYVLEGGPPGAQAKVRHVRLFPPGGIVNSKTGQRADSLDVELSYPVDTKDLFLGYPFRESFELVPGVWTFQVWNGSRKLLEKQFTVYRP